MLALAALFVLAVIAFGRWQGVRSLIGLACSFAVIVGFVVPAILRGHSPVPVALVGAMAIMLASLYLSHGVGRKTTAAVVGTALALGLTGALTAGFVELDGADRAWPARTPSTPASRSGASRCGGCCWPGSSSAGWACSTTSPSPRPRWCSSCAGPTRRPASPSWPGAPWPSAGTTSRPA